MNPSDSNKDMNIVTNESKTTNGSNNVSLSENINNITNNENTEEKKSPNSIVMIQDNDDTNDIPELVDDDGNAEDQHSSGQCPFAENCPVKIAIDNQISPEMVRHDLDMREHINAYHTHMNGIFDNGMNYLLNEIGVMHYILNTTRIIRNGMVNMNIGIETGSDEKENNNVNDNKNRTCELCSNYYDHNEHSKYFMSCCASSYCIKCVSSLNKKEEKCPKCNYSLEYLQKETKLLQSVNCNEDSESEDCFVCCEKLNSSQHNGEVVFNCPCKVKMCITCAYRSLTDTNHVKLGEVQGIPGLILPQNYVVKGCCPTCRQVPTNKDEIIMLYGFLPPRL